MISLAVLTSITLGITLMATGVVRRIRGNAPVWQSGLLIAGGLFLQSWWVALVLLFLFKTIVLREDT